MSIKKQSTLGALLFAGALAITGAAHASALEQFKSFVASTHAAKGEFTQQQMKKSESSKAAPVSSGTFLFARPGKFIWTYVKPYEQLLQADGVDLYICLLYTSPSPRDGLLSRMPSSA